MQLNYSEKDFEGLVSGGKSFVLYKKITTDTITPVLATLKISENYQDYYFLLESVEKGANKGRFSIIGLDPDLVWMCKSSKVYLNRNFDKNQKNFQENALEPLQSLRQIIMENQIDFSNLTDDQNYPKDICSGIFGYMSYEMSKLMENLPNNNLPDEANIPDSIFIRPQIIIVFDSLFDCAFICHPIFIEPKNNDNYQKILQRISDVEKIITAPLKSKNKAVKSKPDFKFTSSSTRDEYCAMVRKAKEYITSGDIFQILPSQRFVSKFDKSLSNISFYRALRHLNPSPFLFYFKFSDFTLVGSSPEIMSSLKGDKVTVRPLAGTRKRGENDIEDKKISAELLADEKEVAEHLMLIDLGRHDVGKVAVKGSVVVTEKMTIENYSHVMHISSNVEGKLRSELTALDVLISSFPAGTVSGAPKIRAMEIIEELEVVKRSFYAGCVGYFSSNGNMETCISLRCALIKDNKIFLQSGAGVVFDSDPESEYKECLNKIEALVKACSIIDQFL